MTSEIQSKEEGVREALRSVIDPEIGMNVMELGLIRDIDIQEERAHITMIMTTPFCPYAPAMIKATRKATQEAIDQPATVDMGTEQWDFSMMEDPSALDWGMYS